MIFQKKQIVLMTAKEFISKVNPEFVVNTESGFNYELHASRTLSSVGEKNTILVVKSTN